MNERVATSTQRSELTLAEFLALIRSRVRLIAFVTIVCTSIAALIAFLSEPTYTAEVLLMPVVANDGTSAAAGLGGQLGGLASLAGISLGSMSDRRTESVATLKSRVLTDEFIKENKLMPVLFAEKWDSEAHAWKDGLRHQPTLWDAYKKIKSIRKVEEDKKTGLLTLRIEWRDPAQAADWATDIVTRANAMLRTQAMGRAQRNIDYLKKQISETSIVEVKQALYRLVESEIKSSMLAESSQDYAFRVIDPAVAPEEKTWPKRAVLLIVGFLGGAFLGLLAALALGASAASRYS